MSNEPAIELTELSYIKLYYIPATDAGKAKHEFTLGVGPCGRYVTELHFLVYDAGYEVIQYSYSTEEAANERNTDEWGVKRFFYPMQSVVG